MNGNSPEEGTQAEGNSNRKLQLIGKLVAIAAVVAGLVVLASKLNAQQYLTQALNWIDGLGALGPIAFMAIYILATVLFIPGSLLTLGSGVLFGWLNGSLYVFVAATLGATAAFLVGRYLARGWVAKQIEGNDKFTAIDKAVADEGFKIVLLTRLSPIFPFNLLNYAFGVTKVSLKDYFLGSVGMLPGTMMYVYIGSLAGSLAQIGSDDAPSNPGIQWALRIVGFLATVAITVYITRIARKALDTKISS